LQLSFQGLIICGRFPVLQRSGAVNGYRKICRRAPWEAPNKNHFWRAGA
jgi:hypothetical protein